MSISPLSKSRSNFGETAMLSARSKQCYRQTNAVLRPFRGILDVKLKLVFDAESVFAIIELAGRKGRKNG